MINTLSNAYCEISLVVKAPHRTSAEGTSAIRALTTRDISQYTSDNIIVLTVLMVVELLSFAWLSSIMIMFS